MDAVQYVRRETAVSVIINCVLTIVLFFVVFGGLRAVPVWGSGGWVFDFLPQSFMIALMSTLVPGFIAQRKVRAGTVATIPATTPLPRNLLIRALVLAIGSAVLGTAIVAMVASGAQQASLPFAVALLLKVVYGAILAAVVTPLALRAALAGT